MILIRLEEPMFQPKVWISVKNKSWHDINLGSRKTPSDRDNTHHYFLNAQWEVSLLLSDTLFPFVNNIYNDIFVTLIVQASQIVFSSQSTT